jgi:predicted metal-dependent hydrolase
VYLGTGHPLRVMAHSASLAGPQATPPSSKPSRATTWWWRGSSEHLATALEVHVAVRVRGRIALKRLVMLVVGGFGQVVSFQWG